MKLRKAHFIKIGSEERFACFCDNSNFKVPGGWTHYKGYSGIAEWRFPLLEGEPLFVPKYCGLNYEHVFNGNVHDPELLFAPRRSPMKLVQIDEKTVELYQKPLPFWRVEATIQYHVPNIDKCDEIDWKCTFKPTLDKFPFSYMGIFFASYLNFPVDRAIYFWGFSDDDSSQRWIDGGSKHHAKQSAHIPPGMMALGGGEKMMPVRYEHETNKWLWESFSKYHPTKNWYIGKPRENFVILFEFDASPPETFTIFVHSPTGGGPTNPAWDFCYVINPVTINKKYTFSGKLRILEIQSERVDESFLEKVSKLI
ncbi:MAG: hypothetical protein ACTSVI_10925 [Promethearchaeota archaeon]